MGDTVGHYRILEAIGVGGMGEVYRAHDERLDRDVALKLLPASSLGDATARARLTREARSAAALNHPHICSVYDVGEEGDQAYIAMELVEGRSLAAVLADRPLPAGQASRYGMQVAEALAHAHERGIVHRDLKSSNVMVTADDRVKVLDFGLARRMAAGAPASNAVTESRPTTLTQPGTLVGTLAYMAPEQLKGARGDARSDIWALGVMLYEMVVGVRPFRGTSGFELAAAVLNEPVPPLPAGAEPRLKAVIARCLAKNPDQRFQGAAEIRAALESGARPARRLGIALPALALAAAVGGGVALFGPRPFSGSRAPRVRALAVLPLENLSGDSSQEYLADGMTEALIAELGRLRGDTKVIGRASVMRYKASKSPPGEIARELNVDALLTGALVRSGDHVRLTAALVDPESGENLWAGRYERDLRDVLVMQSELTQAVLVELRGALGPEATQLLAAARRVDPAAYEDYLKGRFYWYRMTPQDLDTARVYFERALTQDPDYAVAYIGLADAIATPAHAGLMPTTDVFPRARNLVARALVLDPALPEAHDMEARFLFAWDWDWPAAEREFRRALELNPSYPDAHCIYAQLLQSADRLEQSIGEARRAVEIDPQNPFFQLQLAVSLAGAGRTDDAIAEGRRMLAADPGSYVAHDLMWDLHFLEGRQADALREAQASFAALGRQDIADAMAHGAKGGYPAAMAEAAHALAAGRRRAASSYVGAITIARAWAHAGQNERVLEWLQRAAAERDTRMCYVVGDPLYAGIRRDSRFREVVARAQALAQAAASTARAASASS